MTEELHGMAIMVTPFEERAPAVVKQVEPRIDRIVSLAMYDTAVIRAVDTTEEAEKLFSTIYNMVRSAAAQQGLRFNWALYRGVSGKMHFQITQYRGVQRKGRS